VPIDRWLPVTDHTSLHLVSLLCLRYVIIILRIIINALGHGVTRPIINSGALSKLIDLMVGPLELADLLLILQLQVRLQHRVVLGTACLLGVQVECFDSSLVEFFVVNDQAGVVVVTGTLIDVEGLDALVGVLFLDLAVDEVVLLVHYLSFLAHGHHHVFASDQLLGQGNGLLYWLLGFGR
jgi:hypothetical protein